MDSALRTQLVQTIQILGSESQVETLDVVVAAGSSQAVVLFPGDLTTGEAEMLADPVLAPFAHWSSEALARLLASRFPGANIVVVRPSRQHDAFSCFDNFLATNQLGDPLNGEYVDKGGKACAHLLALLQTASKRLGLEHAQLGSQALHVLGFSKGGTVMNQLLTEFGAGQLSEGPKSLLSMTSSFTWLDPGVNEGGPVFVSDPEVLRGAAQQIRRLRPCMQLHVAFTPYQLACDDYEFD
eukprot:gb/GFBE01041608.1/.p1 GENE.gb/GFBE01041608.1/~~gb/GFBE01041608.1/.p1  ORF type:complete len:240 (+),score=48.20 gb/GFBE01041608.1/:1-720(+)